MRFGEYIMPVLLEASWPRIKRMEVKGAAFGVAVKYMPERPSHMGEDGQFDFEQSLRILLPDDAELVVEGQERDYKVISFDDLGLSMFEVDSEFK
ncbi:hypothetical protein HBI55_225760 [Parastagonospora nodorum]|nr:hypothetical protein HBH61_090770 [Parastagonospora nodorum]KAH6130372.1 hypothetical protein HBI64_107880 [Parastagonospora nodorum]KAH6483043.1 hypothetical protein HBI55_225760 [Parastagonospora nodorum]